MYKRYAGLFAFLCLPLGFLLGCGGSSSSSSSTSTPSQAETIGITASGGTSQSAAGGKPFAAPLAATVTTNGVATGGETVTFAAPASGASGTFANGSTTETDATDNDGVAKSSTFTANSVAGAYAVTATVNGVSTPVTFNLTNIATTPYVFYLSGQDSTFSYYALAGAIIVDGNGNVLGGEQDYNDGSSGITSPEPGGDKITGGSLTFPSGYPSGQGILTLNTNNTSLGINADGVETFGVQFVNADHALIMQFDGFATSSGSMDFQTLGTPAAAGNGGYAFAMSGADTSGGAMGFGGVFSLSGTAISNGVLDVNDPNNSVLTTGTAFTATVSTPDTYGRGTIKGVKVSGNKVSLNYYMVGAEALRIIDVDTTDSAMGSAFGQGTSAGGFSNASLGQSVFAVAGNYLEQFGALGQFTTSNTSSSPADFSGVGDDSEPNNDVFTPAGSGKIKGSYSIGSNGYGSFTITVNSNTGEGLGDISNLGIYLTDPALNLDDPNNPAGGGGALIVDLDQYQSTANALGGGVGVIIPQTDTSSADFAGNYAAGWQNFNFNFCGCEFDIIAQGTVVANGALSLTGLVSDPFNTVQPDQTSSGDTFTATPAADAINLGRYTLTKKANSIVANIDGTTITPDFQAIMYQASAGQLFWLGYDLADDQTNGQPYYVSVGPIEQQNSTGLPAGKKTAAKDKSKH
jgi:hypothetical protein